MRERHIVLVASVLKHDRNIVEINGMPARTALHVLPSMSAYVLHDLPDDKLLFCPSTMQPKSSAIIDISSFSVEARCCADPDYFMPPSEE